MMIAMVLAASLQPPPPPPPSCSGAAVQVDVQLALEAVKRRDPAGVQAALESSIANCPAATAPGYLVRVLAADTAAGSGDWARVRALDLPATPPAGVGALAARGSFLRLAADKAAHDTAAFTHDRSAVLARNAAALTARGRRVEAFGAGSYQVDAFEAGFIQGGFRRVLEFVATPTATDAYPVTIMLTDDLGSDRVAAEIAAKKAGAPAPVADPAHPPAVALFFLDLYSCDLHRTLAQMAPGAGGAPPPYAVVKAAVIKALEAPAEGPAPAIAAASVPGGPTAPLPIPPVPSGGVHVCTTAAWLAPGLGLDAAATPQAR